jgi:hypothetical protein
VVNDGSFATPLVWQIEDSEGWLTGAVPAPADTAIVPANGGTLEVQATFHLPADCAGAPTTIRFVTGDPFVPGRHDTCATTLDCSGTTDVATGPGHRLDFGRPWPNPGFGAVRLHYALSRTGHARLTVYGAAGERVRTLADGMQDAGPHEVAWDGRDGRGRRMAPGAYFARLEAEGRVLGHVLTLLR